MLHHYCNAVKLFGSRNSKTRAWESGASVFTFFVFVFLFPLAKKSASPSEGAAEGECGGNSASPDPKRSPAACSVKSRSQQKSFLYLLEEKNGGARKSKIEKKTFLLAGERQREGASVSLKIGSDFVI